MDISIVDISDVEKEIKIQATAEELTPHIDRAYKEYQPEIEIAGFRKGKAPLPLIKRLHGEAIEYKSLDKITTDLYRQIVTERGIQPIGEPSLTDIEYRRGESLTFTVKYEVKPLIQLGEYKNIPVEKPIHRVTEAELEEELLRLRRSNSTKEPAEEVTDDEHVVTADIQQLDETGSPLIGRKTSDAHLYPAGGTLYAEIREALKGMKVGDSRRVLIEREEEGQRRRDNLEITAKKIEKVIIPELNDELVRKITKEKVATVDQFRVKLHEDLEKYWHDMSERTLFDSLRGEIVRRHEFSVPESLVNGFLSAMVEDMKNQSPGKKLSADFDEKQFRESNRGYAIFQAKWFLLQERMIEAEKITVEESDYEELAAKEAPQFGIEKDRLIQFYKSSGSVKERILSTKLATFLKEHARVTEKVIEDGQS